MVSSTLTIEILKKGLRQRFYFRVKATNGEVLAASEKYVNKGACLHAAELVQAGPFEIRDLTG